MKTTLRPERIELGRTVREAVQELVGRYGPRIRLRIEPERPGAPVSPIRGEWIPEGIRRALGCLVDNAVRYGDPQTPVEVLLSVRNGVPQLSVANLGSVIPSEQAAQLLDACRDITFPTVNTATDSGWGRGLSLVRGVARAHGGDLVVESTQAEGTRFTMTLPARARRSRAA